MLLVEAIAPLEKISRKRIDLDKDGEPQRPKNKKKKNTKNWLSDLSACEHANHYSIFLTISCLEEQCHRMINKNDYLDESKYLKCNKNAVCEKKSEEEAIKEIIFSNKHLLCTCKLFRTR